MKITKSKLAQIVQEELKAALNEDVDWDAWEDGYDARDERGDPYEVGERRDAAIKQAIADAQKDFVLVQRGEELAPVPDNFIGTRDEEEAYGDAWGKEIARLQKRAELDSEPVIQEGANKMKITKSKLAQIIKEELQAVTAEGMDTLEAHMLGREHAVEVWRGEREDSDITMMSNAAYVAGFEDATAEIAAEEGEDSLHRDPSHDYEDDSYEEEYDDDGMWENKITKSALAQIVQEELSAVKAEGYKAYKRDDMSPHAKDMTKNVKKGYSPQAAVTAIPDNEEVDKAYFSSLSKKPKRESQLSESDVDPIEAGQDEGIQEFIYQQIADNLQDGPLSADSILSLTEPEYESPREHLADQWEDILAAALHEMSEADEGSDYRIEKSHDTMTGEPYYSPIGFLG